MFTVIHRAPKDFISHFSGTSKARAVVDYEYDPMIGVPAPPPHPGLKLAHTKVRGSNTDMVKIVVFNGAYIIILLCLLCVAGGCVLVVF